MTLRAIRIELRADYDDEEKHELIIEAAKMAAKHLWTTALLIQDKRKPTVAIYTDDMFVGQQEIELADDIDQDE